MGKAAQPRAVIVVGLILIAVGSLCYGGYKLFGAHFVGDYNRKKVQDYQPPKATAAQVKEIREVCLAAWNRSKQAAGHLTSGPDTAVTGIPNRTVCADFANDGPVGPSVR